MRTSIIQCGLLCWVLLLLLLAACSNGATTASKATVKTTQATTTTSTSTQGVGASGCKPPSAITNSAIGIPEVQGSGRGMEIWALLFGDLKAGHDQKIVWRLTGIGDPQFTPTGPQGKQARVVFAPTEHSGSNWHHNGDEWGTGFNFPVAGCWNLHVTREKAVGDVWLIMK